ncbi:hypothetical protein [Dyadobacter sp. 3J3]|uniref:hypothetical protein n=1 Tax=Dyadobacter sp. 3J3 TaxID=2606600 RepID=UPI0013569FF1|nr:hypothetical protein [Dyadobacter sp. 3J3]
MKNFTYLFFAVILFVSLSCSKSDPEPKVVNNIFFESKWQTADIVAEAIYGGVCYQVINFKDNTNFEIYSTRNGQIRSYDSEGIYAITDKAVSLKSVDKSTKKEIVSNFNLENSGTLVRNPKGVAYHTYLKQ